MIQSLAHRYRKQVAVFLFMIFYLELWLPLHAAAGSSVNTVRTNYSAANARLPLVKRQWSDANLAKINTSQKLRVPNKVAAAITLPGLQSSARGRYNGSPSIVKRLYGGGPASPEATSFRPVGSNNLVNLFTGDFSYSIPLLDVGGYPVNLFYTGGIGMEQEASWVGLGWNINPGTVSRNMRGVPDDFDGTDLLIQTQNTKPNKTWGGEEGVDLESLGIKGLDFAKYGFSAGFSYNNYLGPALEVGATLSLSIPIMENLKAEKSAIPSLGASVGAKLSSRSGLTFSPSLSANLSLLDNVAKLGVGLNTSYNSRSGIANLNLHSEFNLSRTMAESNDLCRGTVNMSFTPEISRSIGSSTISFSKPSFMPSVRMPMQNSYFSGQIELGAGLFGGRASGTLNGYYTESKVPIEWQQVKKPLVGFMYAEKANGNVNAVMDFNRLNDAEVTPNTPIISAPMYTYDIFSIQGEGTGGTIRAYRGDLGFMRDNVTTSKDANLNIGADIAPAGHYGFNVNSVSAPTRVGGWEDKNNTLRDVLSFRSSQLGSSFENLYFKNPGEATVANAELMDRIGGDKLVKFQLTGSNALPRIEPKLELFDKKTITQTGTLSILGNTALQNRDKRTQVTTMFSAEDASKIGLEKTIRNYRSGTALFDATDNHLVFDEIPRIDIDIISGLRKKHHISQIDVLEQNGMRYVYGIPVYNKKQIEYTFSVGGTADAENLVNYTPQEASAGSPHTSVNSTTKIDGYVQIQETPAYAASFLLTGLLSPDYVDVTNNGISEDDLGGAVKFNYTKSDGLHKWRTPRKNTGTIAEAATAHFNDGNRSEKKDNKGTVTYGEREVWYVNSIESKAMIAVFKTGDRFDAKGVKSEHNGSVDDTENVNKKLEQIDLFTKSDLKSNGLAGARPIKTIKFYYSYSLCKGTPDHNPLSADPGKGKLTLERIEFFYYGQTGKQNKEKYVFNYGDLSSQTDNPNFQRNTSDKWGTYKPFKDVNNIPTVYPNTSITNIDYPYTSDKKNLNDQFAAAWSLKKILLPTGGQMEISYEADDYAYVQDRRACNMYTIYGLGNSKASTTDNTLYTYNLLGNDNLYVYVKLPQPLQNTDPIKRNAEISSKYLANLNQLAFKLQVYMPKGLEPLTVYATGIDEFGLCTNSSNNDIIYLKIRAQDNRSPLAKSATGFLIENLTGQAFPGYDAAEVNTLAEFLGLMTTMLQSLAKAFMNAEKQVRSDGRAMRISLENSFVRLNDPDKIKYGGGYRVKRVLVRDNWDRMTQQYAATYGQDYEYTTVEMIDGVETTVSSGVASYEPSIGSEENPFREIVGFSNKLPLASAQYGAIEMPMLEALYPSPSVGYSKVTVRSIHRKGTEGNSEVRSAVGKQVTEFYTAKEYPSYGAYTPMTSMDYEKNPFFSFFHKEIINRRIISQGFLVETNDMHGKMKSQASFSESDEKTPLTYSYHTYKNTGKNGLNDKVDFVYNEAGGAVQAGNMGIDMELMTDVREFSMESNGLNVHAQVDIFPFTAFVLVVPTIYPTETYIENKYRAVTCTKLINYHAIEDKVVVIDKGSEISTKTIAYDAETGTPLVTQTANEFNDPIFTASYPAYWAYSGVGLAYKNIGREFSGVTFIDGKITAGVADLSVFESGDELYVTSQSPGVSCPGASPDRVKLWVFDKNKNNTALTVPVKDLYFMDAKGQLFTKTGVSFRIIRSGRRNNLGLTVSSATAMKNPIWDVNGTRKLVLDAASNVVSASAISFKEKWQTDNDVIVKRTYFTPVCATEEQDTIDCTALLEKKINPYVKGLIGNLKPYRSYTYYGSLQESDPSQPTAIRKNGYITGFANFWNFNTSNNLAPDLANPKWVWNTELTLANGKGQELETRDALDRYTSMQYGYNKNMPLAVAQNARYGEAFAEGFEDYFYSESLNRDVPYNCARNYIDLKSTGTIVNTTSGAVKSHSGNHALRVNSNSTVIKTIDVKNINTTDYNLNFGSAVAPSLDSLGGYFTFTALGTGGVYTQAPDTNFGIANFYTKIFPGTAPFHSYTADWTTYIQITTEAIYNFEISMSTSYLNPTSNPPGYNNSMWVRIFDFNNNPIDSQLLVKPLTTPPPTKTYSVTLCPGIYKVVGIINELYVQATGFSFSENSYQWHCVNSSSPTYKDPTKPGCTARAPIPATENMINPSFSLVPGKKMAFSAWVREDCTTPCTKTDYGFSNIEIWANGSPIPASSNTIKRVGNIIEGWQQIEGEFTVPSGVTSAELRLVNSNPNAPMYVDDVRMHPYNSNMKSYVYDNRTLRLIAELDERNYASFYEYDEEGQLIRAKKETIQGVKTIKETRSAKQKGIVDFQ